MDRARLVASIVPEPVAALAIGARPGLTGAEVAERVRAGKTNLAPRSASPPVSRILRRNLLNPINLILLAGVVLVFVVGEGLDAIFAIPLVLNLAIGITQELQAKRRLDHLTLLITPKVAVRRNGEEVAVPIEGVVEDDICLVNPGDQIVADGVVIEEDGLEVDESALTGESDPVLKDAGDSVYSGSFVVAGQGSYTAEKVGTESTAAQLTAEAQAGRERPSPLQRDIVRLLQRLAVVALPVMAAYLAVQWWHHEQGEGLKEIVRSTVTAVVALIPEGLLLLTSARFALGAIRLADKGLVVSRLDAVESLAATTVLCLDKTGTITENKLSVVDLIPAPGVERKDLERSIARFAASMPGANRTVAALAESYPATAEPTEHHIPFSSARRWSGLVLGRGARGGAAKPGPSPPRAHSALPGADLRTPESDDDGAFVLGAPESFPDDMTEGLRALAAENTVVGHRVLYIGTADAGALRDASPTTGPPPSQPLGLAILDDKVRLGAGETLEYFREQEVRLKLISGDNPDTVRAVAARAGLKVEKWTTGSAIAELEGNDLIRAAEENDVFGRVTPQQKRSLIEALRRGDQHVAMTGDGVNDVLALRTADLGIALQEGTAAAQAVSSLVMLEGAFQALPETVKEGRRIVQGITIAARLFLLKTFYAALITAAVTLISIIGRIDPQYPFRPRNLSMMSTFSIGIPAFFLTLAPRRPDRPSRKFLSEVVRLAVPAAVVTAAVGLVTYYVIKADVGGDLQVARSATSLAVALVAMAYIPCAELAAPRGRQRQVGLAFALAGMLSLAFPLIFAFKWTRTFYDVVSLTGGQVGVALIAAAAGIALLAALVVVLRRAEAPGRTGKPGVLAVQ